MSRRDMVIAVIAGVILVNVIAFLMARRAMADAPTVDDGGPTGRRA